MTQDLQARAPGCVPAVSALGCLWPLGLLLPSGSWPKSASRGAWEMGGLVCSCRTGSFPPFSEPGQLGLRPTWGPLDSPGWWVE